MLFSQTKTRMPTPEEALSGRDEAMRVADKHLVLGNPMTPPWPEGYEQALFGMGCFWGSEQLFWKANGVWTTAVGYSGGFTPNPTYEEVCSGRTGHTEAVLVVFDPAATSYENILKVFWENHDPTQFMRQHNDVGTQYRSGIYTFSDGQLAEAQASLDAYQGALDGSGYGTITTEVVEAKEFYYAEDYHQQYLAKNPNGYCNHGFCQVPYDATARSTT